MQMAQGASTNPWEEKDKPPSLHPPPAMAELPVSECGMELQDCSHFQVALTYKTN